MNDTASAGRPPIAPRGLEPSSTDLWVLGDEVRLAPGSRERGMLKDTLVVAMGEFGRTPEINPAEGPPWVNRRLDRLACAI